MVDVPGPGNFRGDGGPGRRGLGGLWDLLNTIATGIGSLASIASDIAALRATLDRLVGPTTPDEWVGLIWFLDRALGRVDTELQNPGNSIFANVQGTATNAQRIAQYLTAGSIGGANTPYLLTLRNLAQDQKDILTTISGAVLDPTILPSVPYLRQIRDAVGSISDTPNGKTVKLLLDELLACCAEGGGGGGTLNDPPTLCAVGDGWSSPVRCTRFEEIPNGSGSGVYGVVFDTGLAAIGLQNQADTSPTWNFPGLRSLSGDDIDLCFSWDLTPYAGTGLAYSRQNTVAADWGTGDVLLGSPVSLQPSPANLTTRIFAGRAGGLQVNLDSGAGPLDINFFVQARGVAS